MCLFSVLFERAWSGHCIAPFSSPLTRLLSTSLELYIKLNPTSIATFTITLFRSRRRPLHALKTLFNIVEAPLKIVELWCLCCMMMFRWTIINRGVDPGGGGGAGGGGKLVSQLLSSIKGVVQFCNIFFYIEKTQCNCPAHVPAIQSWHMKYQWKDNN